MTDGRGSVLDRALVAAFKLLVVTMMITYALSVITPFMPVIVITTITLVIVIVAVNHYRGGW